MQKLHIDCEEYLAIDVFKGFCSTKKMIVLADEEGCEELKQAKKCRICKHFTPTKEYLGVCMGKTTAYPDLLARTCNDFEWNDK